MALNSGAGPLEGKVVDGLCQSLKRQQQKKWEEPELQQSHKLSAVVDDADKKTWINSWKENSPRAIRDTNVASDSGNSLTANNPKDTL